MDWILSSFLFFSAWTFILAPTVTCFYTDDLLQQRHVLIHQSHWSLQVSIAYLHTFTLGKPSECNAHFTWNTMLFSHTVSENGCKCLRPKPWGHYCQHASKSGWWCQSVSQGQVMANDGKLEWRLPAARSPGQQRIRGKKATEKMAVKHRDTIWQTQRPSSNKDEWLAKSETHITTIVQKTHFSCSHFNFFFLLLKVWAIIVSLDKYSRSQLRHIQ